MVDASRSPRLRRSVGEYTSRKPTLYHFPGEDDCCDGDLHIMNKRSLSAHWKFLWDVSPQHYKSDFMSYQQDSYNLGRIFVCSSFVHLKQNILTITTPELKMSDFTDKMQLLYQERVSVEHPPVTIRHEIDT